MEEKEKKTKREKEKFHIAGKVKTEEEGESIAGLKVMAYVTGTKKQLGSAITDSDGTYKIEFEHDKPVDVNISVCPDVDEKVLKIIPKAKHFIPKDAWVKRRPYHVEKVDVSITPPIWKLWETICKKYTIFGMVVKGIPDPDNPGSYLNLIPIPDATVHIYDVDPSWFPKPSMPPWPPMFRHYYEHEIGTTTTDENGLFVFDFDWCYSSPHIHPWWRSPFPDTKPDILFKVTQTVNSVEVPFYEEDPSQTRWNIEQLPLGVTLIVEGEVILPDDPMTPITGDFEFHGIGRVLISQIDSEGYADTSGTGDVVGARDSPFGSTIDVKGQFNNSLPGKYYQVLYAKWENDTTPPNPGDFTPILDEVWPVAQKIGDNWVTVYKSPVELPVAGGGCYEIPDYTDLYLTSKEILIRWATHRKDLGAPRYPNGKYSLMIKVFNADGTQGLGTQPINTFIVRVDNTWPVAKIKEDISIIGGTVKNCDNPILSPGEICDSPEVCGIIYLESGKQLRVKFDAYDEQNHFRNYKLTYRTGHGSEVNIPNGSKYFTGPPRKDYGFTNETVDWNIGGLDQCGYEIRLRVWDRTINGYYHIHWREDFIHIVLLNKPAP